MPFISTLLAPMLTALAMVGPVDRPGTPNKVVMVACDQSRAAITGGASVCVEFNNTAKEDVFFEFEFTENGVPIRRADPARGISGHGPAYCPGRDTFKPPVRPLPNWRPIYPFGCAGADNFSAVYGYGRSDSHAHGRTNIDLEQDGVTARTQKLVITHLGFDARYCIRVRSRALGSDLVSALWSGPACAQTPGPPPPPAAPTDFTLDYTKGGADWRQAPPNVTLHWTPATDAAVHVIEEGVWQEGRSREEYMHQVAQILPWGKLLRTSDAQAYASYADELIHPGPDHRAEARTYSEPLSLPQVQARWRVEYRVCAVSAFGRACSRRLAVEPPGGSAVLATQPGRDLSDPVPPRVPRNVPVLPVPRSHPAESQPGTRPILPADRVAETLTLSGREERLTTGEFDTSFGHMTLDRQAGRYASRGGRLRVTRRIGTTIEGEWREDSGARRCRDGLFRGRFQLQFAPGGFNGSFGYCDEALFNNWSGRRVR